MNVSLYQNAGALVGLEKWQQATAQNLSSTVVPGYKQNMVVLRGVPEDNLKLGEDQTFEKALDLTFPKLKTAINFQDGGLLQTNNPTDFGIQGKGFFKLQKPDGQFIYTRDGEFSFNSEGYLVSKEGFLVEGIEGPIQKRQDRSGKVALTAQGDLYQEEVRIGKLTLFDAEDKLTQARRASGGFTFGEEELEALESFSLTQGFLEGSNFSPLQEMVNLIRVSQSFELNQKVISEMDQQLGQTIQTLGNTQR